MYIHIIYFWLISLFDFSHSCSRLCLSISLHEILIKKSKANKIIKKHKKKKHTQPFNVCHNLIEQIK